MTTSPQLEDQAHPAARVPWWPSVLLAALTLLLLILGQWLALLVVGVALASGGWVARLRATHPQVRAAAGGVAVSGLVMAGLAVLALAVLFPIGESTATLEGVYD